MRTLKTTTIVSAAFLSLLLSACGGGASSPLDPKPSSAASSSKAPSSSSSSTSSIDTTSPAEIGRGDGDTFVSGEIAVSHTSEKLPAGGSTILTVSIVSITKTLVTAPVLVTFNSRCFSSGEAELTSNSGGKTNKVATEIGQATITYTAKGCVGIDEITATMVIDDVAKVARKTIDVAQDTVQSIRFMEATPDKIFLKDSGGAQTSSIRFQVLGSTGAPIKNVPLNFSLSTSVGGIALTTANATTNNLGFASTTVQAGTIPTAVEVIVTEPQSGVTARSNKLSIGTGIPDQNSMSISASRFNPPGWNRDGEEVNITVRMADAFNNPPPDGTSVQFTTEGGVIADRCTTFNGACTVIWKSQNSRPSNGRVTILATTLGNESFIDTNGDGLYSQSDLFTDENKNGQYDSGEPYIDLDNNGIFSTKIDIFNSYNPPANGDCDPNVPRSTAESNGSDHPCDDLGEAYVDKNENGKHDNDEEFTDFNLNREHDKENGKYNGVLCIDDQNLGANCTKEPINIREEIVLSMSSDKPYTTENGLLIGQPESIEMGANDSYSFTVTLADIHGNAMPVGTTVSLITTTASDVTINQNMPSSGVPSTLNPTAFSVTLKASKTERPSGSFGIAIKSPNLETVYTTRIIPKPLENTTALYIGKGLGASFISGAIELGIGDAVLPPGGSTSLSVNLVDEDRNSTTGSAQVNFTSACIRAGTATLTDSSGTETTSVTTQTGRATINYTADGCMGEDEITATSNVSSLLVNTATATVTITEVSPQSIQFTEAEPELITLKGTGGIEISQVTFTVIGPNGLPLAGVPVKLKLNNSVGDVCIVETSSLCIPEITRVSDGNGLVTASVQSGDIATTVRVTASASNGSGGTISTQSSRLVISTGIPDQDSMSMAASEHSIYRSINGYPVELVIRMADAFNNPIPENTPVYFTTSGGLIEDQCLTDENSTCTVSWFNQAPKPANGRVTILATALGNESFTDTNGDGLFNGNDTLKADLGEAFLDTNQNGSYDLTDGYFVDIFGPNNSLGGDGVWTPGNNQYDGALCVSSPANPCTKNSVTVRDEVRIVLSTGIAATVDGRLPGQLGSIDLGLDDGTLAGEQTMLVTLIDTNGNSMPSGTEVTVDDGDLENATVYLNPEPVIVSNTATGATTFEVTVISDRFLPVSGRFRLQVKTPDKGGVLGSTYSYTTRVNAVP